MIARRYDKLPEVMKLFYSLVWVMVTWVFTFIRSHQTTPLKSMHFVVCELCLKNDLTKSSNTQTHMHTQNLENIFATSDK